jgi:hypothetical protein
MFQVRGRLENFFCSAEWLPRPHEYKSRALALHHTAQLMILKYYSLGESLKEREIPGKIMSHTFVPYETQVLKLGFYFNGVSLTVQRR